MSETTTKARVEEIEYTDRYHLESAKSAIQTVVQVIEEAVSNEDEAIRQRAERDGGPNRGRIVVAYNPKSEQLTVRGDGAGMTSERMLQRLRTVGGTPDENSKRSYFNRGIRDVFLALGGGEITSIGENANGEQLLSKCTFLVDGGKMSLQMDLEDEVPSAEQREALGLERTGTVVTVPVRSLKRERPRQFDFGIFALQIEKLRRAAAGDV